MGLTFRLSIEISRKHKVLLISVLMCPYYFFTCKVWTLIFLSTFDIVRVLRLISTTEMLIPLVIHHDFQPSASTRLATHAKQINVLSYCACHLRSNKNPYK